MNILHLVLSKWLDKMAIFTINIPSNILPEAVEAYCDYYNYQSQIETENGLVTNPESKPEFTKRMIRKCTVDIIKSYRIKSIEGIRESIIADTETDCELILVE